MNNTLKKPEEYREDHRISPVLQDMVGVTPKMLDVVRREGFEIRMKTRVELKEDPTSLLNIHTGSLKHDLHRYV